MTTTATDGGVYRDLGGDTFTRRDNPDRRRIRLVNWLAALGYQVGLTPRLTCGSAAEPT